MAEQVAVTYMEVVKKSQEVVVPAGDSTVQINLPAAVPEGKKLVITVEIRGQMQDV